MDEERKYLPCVCGREAELQRLRAEVEKLRRVRDAAEKVRGLGMLCMMSKHCEECNTLRAALDAAKEG